jgi:DNA-binding cell septation regulator SpoVG
MAERKQHTGVQPEQEAPQQAPASPEAGPQAEQAPPSLPDLTVRIFPIKNSKSKLRATANVNIAGAFAVRGFRIFDSKNGLFVKEPEQSYVKEGTELTRSVFFPVTKEAREALHGQILHSYELVMEKEMNQRQDDLEYLLSDEDAPPERAYEPPLEDDDLPFDFGQSM